MSAVFLPFNPLVLPYGLPCIAAPFVRREKRFFALCRDVQDNIFSGHTNNTGSMLGLLSHGAERFRLALLSPASSPGRKLPWTLEAVSQECFSERIWKGMLEDCGSTQDFGAYIPAFQLAERLSGVRWTGVNTSVPNRFLQSAFFWDRAEPVAQQRWKQTSEPLNRRLAPPLDGQLEPPSACLLPWAAGYEQIRMEAKNGESRLDALLTADHLPPLWVECKNVSLSENDVACFPDAVSERGAKHLGTLMRLVAEGCRAAMFYVVQRTDASCFAPADFIDPVYARTFAEALQAGVEAYAIAVCVKPDGVYFEKNLHVLSCSGIFGVERTLTGKIWGG